MGVSFIEDVEDAAQAALLRALETWTRGGVPENPSAWLFRVAHNHLMGELRQRAGRSRILEERGVADAETFENAAPAFLPEEVRDDVLRMLFVCCDEAIPLESQLVLALKSLCGFDVGEIAHRLFTSEANVYKRLGRARSRLRTVFVHPGELSGTQYVARLPSVSRVLYLLFTEGYLSSHAEDSIRRELCDEAIRLTTLLVEHPIGQVPQSYALLALMHLHLARLGARQDASGGLLLLEEQDRSLWDRDRIRTGMAWLARSAGGDDFSRYHAEAGIAAEHCLAASFKETRWDRVVACYSLLNQVAPSAVHKLNQAVAVAEWKSPAEGLRILEGFEPPTWLTGSFLWSAVLADLNRRCGKIELAQRHRDIALRSAPSPAIKVLLRRRLRMDSDDLD